MIAELSLSILGASRLQDLHLGTVVKIIQILADSHYTDYLPRCATLPRIVRK